MKTNNLFKTLLRVILPVILLALGQSAFSQATQAVPVTQQMPDTAKMTYNQISKAMNLYVYPSKNQSQSKQKKDEFACYQWAVEQSGIDPLNLPKVEAAPVKSGPTGGAVRGAARGAAAGAAIGAIAGDAGKGAAIGAAAGGMKGVSQGQQAQAQQNQKSQADAKAKEQEMKNSFVKAFSVCIEGKGYTVK